MRALVTLLIVVAATQAACSRSVQQKDFASAEEAAQALVAAAQSDDTRALLEVLGQEAEPVVGSGDPVQDKNSRERFLQAYATAHALDTSVEGVTTLEVGTDKWPFPFPIVQRDGRWRFDSTAGVEEIVNRRVGANELATIQSCLAFVDAATRVLRSQCAAGSAAALCTEAREHRGSEGWSVLADRGR